MGTAVHLADRSSACVHDAQVCVRPIRPCLYLRKQIVGSPDDDQPIVTMFGSFEPFGRFSPPEFTRACRPTLFMELFHSFSPERGFTRSSPHSRDEILQGRS